MPSKPRKTIKGKIKTASGDKNAEVHGDVAIEARRRFGGDSVTKLFKETEFLPQLKMSNPFIFLT